MLSQLKEDQLIYCPELVAFQRENLWFFVDPEGPNWFSSDERAKVILGWLEEPKSFGALCRLYASYFQLEFTKAHLHIHLFVRECLRLGFFSLSPIQKETYRGRAFHLKVKTLRELWLHTNNSCNLTCTHCLVESSPVADSGLPTKLLLEIINQAVECGVERFYFTGGEPFIRSDIFELIQTITQEKKLELVILTNGLFFQGKQLEHLEKVNRNRLRLQVSVDGAQAESNDHYRGEGTFDKIARGTKAITNLGFSVSLTSVVTKKNMEEMPQITRLVKDWGAESQHLMWLHHRGRIIETDPDSFPDTDNLIRVARETVQQAKILGVSLDNFESLKLRVNGTPYVKYDLGNQFWDSLCIYSDGTVYPSAAFANHYPLAAGKITKETLRQIWHKADVGKKFRAASIVNNSSIIQDPFRYILGGGDIEHSYFFNLSEEGLGDLHGPDPYYQVYKALAQDVMFELADKKRKGFNQNSGFDAPVVFHSMGEGAVNCNTSEDMINVDQERVVDTLHSNCVLAFDIDGSRSKVREFYGKAAVKPQAELCCPLNYDAEEISHIPDDVVERFYGCGSPISMADLIPGETALDLGSGGGIDCFVAAKKVGAQGKVIGVDMTKEMLSVANINKPKVAENLGYDVVDFRQGFLEKIPVETKTIDLITSNCVINLSPEKKAVFSEMWRVLKNHGRIVLSDVLSEEPLPIHMRVNSHLWGECIAGALTEEEFLVYLEQAGFYGLQILNKRYWKEVEGYSFFSMTIRGYKLEKTLPRIFQGQTAIYLGPQKAVIDEEGHFFPRNEPVEICSDTAKKLSKPPYKGRFKVLETGVKNSSVEAACCEPDSPCC